MVVTIHFCYIGRNPKATSIIVRIGSKVQVSICIFMEYCCPLRPIVYLYHSVSLYQLKVEILGPRLLSMPVKSQVAVPVKQSCNIMTMFCSQLPYGDLIAETTSQSVRVHILAAALKSLLNSPGTGGRWNIIIIISRQFFVIWGSGVWLSKQVECLF